MCSRFAPVRHKRHRSLFHRRFHRFRGYLDDVSVPDPFARLFSQEMRALSEEGASFAADFPEAARYLNPGSLEDRDPYVERLTEGAASLVARIRQSAGTEEFDQALLEQFAPELVQPLSSVCVVRFQSGTPLTTVVDLPSGAMVRSRSASGAPGGVPFRLLHPVQVTPVAMESAKWTTDERGESSLELSLRWKSKRGLQIWPDRIPFYLLADAPVVWALRHGLVRKVRLAEIWQNGSWHPVPGITFSTPEFHCYTTESDGATPLAKARDFLCADERFRFVELCGISAAGIRVNRTLRLRLRMAGSWPRGFSRGVSESTFQLHAGVVVNRSLEPLQGIHWDHTRTEARLLPVGGKHREVLDVRSVRGIEAAPGHRKIDYRPHSMRMIGRDSRFYALVRETSPSGTPVVRIGLGAFDSSPDLFPQNLSIDGICGDGDFPHEELAAADVSIPASGIPAGIGLRGLVRPGASFRPAQGVSVRSVVLALAQGHSLGWMDAERLKDGLRQVLWDASETKRTLIEAIQEVTVRNGHVLDNGVAWRRMEVEIRLRDATCTPETWDRIGILDAFGSVLFAFVEDATEIGSRSRLRVLVEPSGIALDYGASP